MHAIHGGFKRRANKLESVRLSPAVDRLGNDDPRLRTSLQILIKQYLLNCLQSRYIYIQQHYRTRSHISTERSATQRRQPVIAAAAAASRRRASAPHSHCCLSQSAGNGSSPRSSLKALRHFIAFSMFSRRTPSTRCK
jgi:hypothetical protein